MKKRIRGLLSLLLVLAMCISLMPGIALAADDDEPTPAEPKAGKSITDNGDGTYTISLSIEGDAQMPNQDKNVVNVLIVYDISQSMSTTAEGSTHSRGDEAENVVHGFLNTLLGKQADSNGTVEVNTALVTFG